MSIVLRSRKTKARRTLATILAATPGSHWWDMRVPTAQSGWRRNLLGWSEDFSNAVWYKTGVTVTANSATAPDGSLTADALTETAITDVHRAYTNASAGAGALIGSVYAKANGRSWMRLECSHGNSSLNAFFNLTTGVLGTVSAGVIATITSVGDGWYRCTAYHASHAGYAFVYVANSDNSFAYLGDITKGIYVWGAQLESGTTATTYQKITDGYTEFLAAYPTTALFQDAAGTQPVTAVGQYLGLCLDKPAGSVQYGPELVTNGGFDADTTGWVAGFGVTSSTLVASGGIATLTHVGADTTPRYRAAVSGLTSGKSYKIGYQITSVTGAGDRYVIFTSAIGGTGGVQTPSLVTGVGNFVAAATASTMYVAVCNNNAGAGSTTSFDNISVREVIGTPLTQSTTTKRPQLLGTPALPKFDGADDAMTTGAITLTSNMDCFMVVRRDSAANVVMANDTISRFFCAFSSGSALRQSSGNAGTSQAYKVDGVFVGTDPTFGELHTAVSVGALHIVEVAGLNLSSFTKIAYGDYSSWGINGSIPEVVLTPALSDADRTIVRKELASRYGITL